MVVSTESKTKEPKDLRYRRQYFPNADNLVFDTKNKGFIPLPIMLRKLIAQLTAPELRVLIYLYLRASRYGICYPTLDEMAAELRLTGRKNLTPHIEALENKRFISTRQATGKRFFLIHDPRIPIQYLAEKGDLKEQELFDINELYKDLGQTPLDPPPSPSAHPGDSPLSKESAPAPSPHSAPAPPADHTARVVRADS